MGLRIVAENAEDAGVCYRESVEYFRRILLQIANWRRCERNAEEHILTGGCKPCSVLDLFVGRGGGES